MNNIKTLLLIALVASTLLVGIQCDNEEEVDVQVEEENINDQLAEPVPELPDEIEYSSPQLDRENRAYYLYEHFDDPDAFDKKWVRSKATKADSEDSQYDGEWELTETHPRVKGKESSF